jgi:hypothetical protein
MQFQLRSFDNNYSDIHHYVLIADAADGYLTAACFDFRWYYFGHYYQYKFNGNDGRSWAYEKNYELARRIADALYNDARCQNVFGSCYDVWFGVDC